MGREYRLISADSHINEPPDLWTARLPAKFKDRAPRMERFEKGDAWIMAGALIPNAGVDTAVAEFERALALPGMRGAMIAQYPHGGEVIAPEDDALWGAMAAAGVPLSLHVAFALEAQRDTSKMKLTGSLRFF